MKRIEFIYEMPTIRDLCSEVLLAKSPFMRLKTSLNKQQE